MALPLRLLPSLLTVFSIEFERRLTRLREVSLSLDSARPMDSGEVSMTTLEEGGIGVRSGGTCAMVDKSKGVQGVYPERSQTRPLSRISPD